MADKKWLRTDGGRLTHKPHIPGHGSTRVYIVTADFLSTPDEERPANEDQVLMLADCPRPPARARRSPGLTESRGETGENGEALE